MHTWKFYRTGGLDQVLIRNGADIANLKMLDQKLWTVLSCPTKGIRFDQKTLELLDADNDGRIRVPELLAAIEWLSLRLVSLDTLLSGSQTLPLSAFNRETPEGKALAASARRILSNLGKATSEVISLENVTDTSKIFAETRFNGDGVVPADVAEDESTRQVINEIIATFGSVLDRSGKPGINQEKADAFFEAAKSYLVWAQRADSVILPLGDKTAKAFEALSALRVKLDDYFTRCRLSAFDARSTAALNSVESGFALLANQELTETLPAIAAFPLSEIGPARDLPLTDEVNPYWAKALEVFEQQVVKPLLGASCNKLSDAQWQRLKEIFAPYEAWLASKVGGEVESLGIQRLAALLASDAKTSIDSLIAQDAALATENAQIDEVEKVLRFNMFLHTLLRNFVNMAQLYDPKAIAIFQVGTLYMDARAASLCFHVDDVNAHAGQASASKCCLAYCNLTRPGTKETRTICATFTAGFAKTLWVGRNGIFYDRDGKDWDATIVKVIDHSISLKEAFWDPWYKMAGMISTQVRKVMAAKQDATMLNAAKRIETTTLAPADAPKKPEGAALASTAAAMGIAVGLISTAVAGFVNALSRMPLWKTALGLVVLLLIISGPSMILTWFKLRARNVAPILNACGWAVNRNLRLTLKLGRIFTTEALLPPHSEHQLTDPFADDNTARNRLILIVILIVLVLILWYCGLFNSVLPQSMQRVHPSWMA
jgi:hypothetical protein